MNFREKIISWDNLAAWRAGVRSSGKRLVVTNGCFDLLHLGHVTYLENARNQGDALMIGLNSDASVRQLKGPARPVVQEQDRAGVLAALASVDGVCIFEDLRATRLLDVVHPDVYVKGGDYTVDQLPKEECDVVRSHGGRIVIIPFLPGRSTTSLLEKIARL